MFNQFSCLGEYREYKYEGNNTGHSWKDIHEQFAEKCENPDIFEYITALTTSQGWCMTERPRSWAGPSSSTSTVRPNHGGSQNCSGRSANFYHKKNWEPEWSNVPKIPDNV